MKKFSVRKQILLSFIVSLIISLPINAQIRYVKNSDAPSNIWEGKTNVYNSIADAISAADSEDEIWIAGGTYELGQGGINYNVPKNLKFYGSFAGTESSIEERVILSDGKAWDFENPTVLKMTYGSTAIWINNASIRAVIDGLTIDGDNIQGTRGIGGGNWTDLVVSRCVIKNHNMNGGNGGGILAIKKITVEHSLIDNNATLKPSSSPKWGGGICILAANSVVRNSTISNNTYNDSGAGIGIDNVGGVIISDCHIHGNETSNSGGGVCGYQIAELRNSLIENNKAGNGAGVFHRAYSGSGLVYNNIIVNNTSTSANSGGGFTFGNSTNAVKLYNCIIANNKSGGGGVSFTNNTANHQVINTILYNNTNGADVLNVIAAGSNNIFKNNILDTNTVSNLNLLNCLVETEADKLFTDISNGDYTPPINFIGEDKGDASNINFSENTDFAGNLRIQGEAIDIGVYEAVPSSLVSLQSLTIDGELIEGFMPGLVEYNVKLPASSTDYPTIEVIPTSSSATVSAFTYTPVVFNPDVENRIEFTVTKGENSTKYSIRFVVDYMPDLAHTILMRIRADRLTRNMQDLEANLDEFLPKLKADGSFSDCHYVSQGRGDSEVLIHLDRLREMGIAYTQKGNKYFEDATLYAKIVKAYELWYSKNWTDNNWWYNRIAHPQRLGEALIAMYGGKKDIRKEKIFDDLVLRWRNNMGDTDSPNDATTAGANKSDIAMHWIYRSCLTLNEADLAKAADRSFLIIEQTTGEGLQHDWSFLQHGQQLYIGGYGTEFIKSISRQASYLAGTKYALSGEKLNIFSQFALNTYLPIIRGKRMSFSALGRGLTRENNPSPSDLSYIFSMLKEVDVSNALAYENAIKRLTGEESASYQIGSKQTHYYRGEYTFQQRPTYHFDIRMASKRLMRSEYDINENRQGFFLTEGATGIYVDGEEYGTIIPFWDWKKIPGTTVPYFDSMRRADSYLFAGRSSLAGGVTDGQYGVTAFESFNDQALLAWNDDDGYLGTPNNSGTRLPKLDFGSKKSWFIFDNEIVALGAGIYSNNEEEVLTTVNQARQAGDIKLSSNGVVSDVAEGSQTYSNVDWVLNDKVAYYFPTKPEVHVANETKTGAWSDVNNNGRTSQYSEDLFTLWLNHGVKPTNENYAYIIVPNIDNETKAKAYSTSDISILANNDSVQVVYHKGLNIYGFSFFKSASFVSEGLAIDVSSPCVMLIKDFGEESITLTVADPQKQASPITIGVGTKDLDEMKLVTYQNPAAPHQGKSVEFTVDNQSPKYEGKDVLLKRDDWTIRASSVGPTDNTVAPEGDKPEYMIDNDDVTSFLFVKPGKNFGGVTVPANTKPWFEIDMKKETEMTYMLYRHRDYKNTLSMLRASAGSFYGKNREEDAYEPILENFSIATNVTELRIDLPKKVSYRYVKFVFEEWDNASGSTIQLSEFNIGNKFKPAIDTNTANKLISTNTPISIYPNPIKAGQVFTIGVDKLDRDSTLSIYTLSGVKIGEQKILNNKVENIIHRPGVYLLYLVQNNNRYPMKLIVE